MCSSDLKVSGHIGQGIDAAFKRMEQQIHGTAYYQQDEQQHADQKVGSLKGEFASSEERRVGKECR